MAEDLRARIANDFVYHAPFGTQVLRYESLRASALDPAEMFITYCPPSRELSLALTNLEQAMFWANASIARHEKNDG